jgi:hypothetical protein
MGSYANHVWFQVGPFRRVCVYCHAEVDYSSGAIRVYGGHFTGRDISEAMKDKVVEGILVGPGQRQ